MTNAFELGKEELRRRVLALRRALSEDERTKLSAEIAEKVAVISEYKRASTIASYVAKKDEVHTSYIINRALEDKKRVIVPSAVPAEHSLVFSEIRSIDELTKGHFGVPEPRAESLKPVRLTSAELILVPVVAWDEKGFRLGYGHGYFDRALVSAKDSFAVGLAFELQKTENVPHLAHDVRLHAVVTEKRVVRF